VCRDPVVALNGEATPSGVETDRAEPDDLLPPGDSIHVPKRERTLAEGRVPLDAIEKISKGLHRR
jgi:hypothetical protein